MIKNQAGQVVTANLVALADGTSITSGAVTVEVLGDGGTKTAGLGTIENEGGGTWSYFPTQAETNYASVTYSFSHADALRVDVQFNPVVSGTVSPAPAGVRGGWFGAGWFGGGVGAATVASASTLANGTIEARVGELKRVLIPCNQDISSSTLSFIVETKQKVDVGIVDDGSITKDGTTAELTLTAPMTSAERTLDWSLVIVGTNESVASGKLFCTYDAQGD